MILLGVLISLILVDPNILGDPENYNKASPINTPPHIQPEWYYLFAYAILRSIPRKFGGVLALVASIAILITLPFSGRPQLNSTGFYLPRQILFWFFIVTVCLLTWIGARPVEAPYVITGQLLTLLYFSFFLTNPYLHKLWDSNLATETDSGQVQHSLYY